MYHSHSTVSIISRPNISQHKLTYNTMHNNFNTRISKFVLLYTAVHFIELNLGSAFLGDIFWGILDYIKSYSSWNCFLVCSLVEANLFHKLTLDQHIGLFLFPFSHPKQSDANINGLSWHHFKYSLFITTILSSPVLYHYRNRSFHTSFRSWYDMLIAAIIPGSFF